jgi:deoxycytidylate deaminase
MSTEDYKTAFESISKGQLPGSELVIGLVGAVGAGLHSIVADLTSCLGKYGYLAKKIHVSDLIEDIIKIPQCDSCSEFKRISALMTAGNNARKKTGENAILALSVVLRIYGERVEQNRPNEPQLGHAYIINSLKHPEEVDALRRIYGNGFFLMGVYVPPEQRKKILIYDRNMSLENAEKLMDRDEAEGADYGQHTRDTFHLSDFFVHLRDEVEGGEERTQATLERFLDIIFGDPYRTPLFDEYAMFMASAAATRSADLSRQIGAVIARKEEVLASGVNECPRFGGGTYWPKLDNTNGEVTDKEDGRDYMRGCDSNKKEKGHMIDEAIRTIKQTWRDAGKAANIPDEDLLRQALKSSPIDDITEYGRVVHAEMDALLTCARNNISCRGGTLYSTTFPCHNCVKHIIAAGIERVVYIEPYPKSKALDFHKDSADAGFKNDENCENKVAFEPFVGVGPRRFFDLFSMKQGSGYPLKRKDKTTGKNLAMEARMWQHPYTNVTLELLPARTNCC